MEITKVALQNILDGMQDKEDIEEIFDRILISAKIDQALLESEQGLGQDWNEFKEERLKESYKNCHFANG